ncbi:MAG: class I SAM-dependent RNA methyltransferase, partial [Hyphomicrobiales bacterium]
MTETPQFEIFLVATPGLEAALCAEALAQGFADAKLVEGGVTLSGGWPEVWRANLELRGPTRVLVRIASFRAMHLEQLDKRARKVAWGEFLRADVPLTVEASCRKSKIYHAGAAALRN